MRTLLKWGASLALLCAAVFLLDWNLLVESATRLTPWAFLAAVMLACAQFIPLAARWHSLAEPGGGWYACSARYLYANLLNAVSPGNVGGDVYRFFAFRTAERSDLALVTILVRERLLGLASMLIGLLAGVAGVQLAGSSAGQGIWQALGIASAFGLAALALLPWLIRRIPMPSRWRERLQGAIAEGSAQRNVVLLGWSLLALALWIAAVWFVAVRLGLDLPWHVLLAVVTAAELVRIVPVTIQGLGLREGAFAALLGLSGYAPESGFVLGAVAYLALSAALVLTGALGAAMLARPPGD